MSLDVDLDPPALLAACEVFTQPSACGAVTSVDLDGQIVNLIGFAVEPDPTSGFAGSLPIARCTCSDGMKWTLDVPLRGE